MFIFFFFQAEDGIRDVAVTGVQTCALPISTRRVISSGARRNLSPQSASAIWLWLRLRTRCCFARAAAPRTSAKLCSGWKLVAKMDCSDAGEPLLARNSFAYTLCSDQHHIWDRRLARRHCRGFYLCEPAQGRLCDCALHRARRTALSRGAGGLRHALRLRTLSRRSC